MWPQTGYWAAQEREVVVQVEKPAAIWCYISEIIGCPKKKRKHGYNQLHSSFPGYYRYGSN